MRTQPKPSNHHTDQGPYQDPLEASLTAILRNQASLHDALSALSAGADGVTSNLCRTLDDLCDKQAEIAAALLSALSRAEQKMKPVAIMVIGESSLRIGVSSTTLDKR